jgi:hypothetical protein
MESRALLVDVSEAMGSDLQVAKKVLLAMARQKMFHVCDPPPRGAARSAKRQAPLFPPPPPFPPCHRPPRTVWP